jgi:hypothetical protein
MMGLWILFGICLCEGVAFWFIFLKGKLVVVFEQVSKRNSSKFLASAVEGCCTFNPVFGLEADVHSID